jgi:hypothetical protein
MVMQLPHEALSDEVASNPEAAKLELDPEWTDGYRSHRVVRMHPDRQVIPYALYMDGISFTNTDSLLAFFVYSLITRKRHLCAIVRKSAFCRCGCRGWCTLYPILRALRWSFEQLAIGRHPEQDINGPWAAGSQRSENAGEPLNLTAALLHIKADWAEFAHTLSFASWSSVLFCCMFCKCTKVDRFDVKSFNPFDSTWDPIGHDDMERAVSACERLVHLSKVQYTKVKGALFYEKSKLEGGRVLKIDIPELGLKKGDRLEPHGGLPDVSMFDQIIVFPCRALFWRRGLETRCKHRNPLFDWIGDLQIGVTLDTCQIDKLHTLYLGPAQSFVVFSLWQLIKADAFGTHKTGTELHQLSIMQIRSKLWTWYSDRRRARPEQEITEVQDLTLAMLGGKASSESLHTKAAETKGLVPFALHLLREAKAGTVPKNLIDAGQALQDYFDLLDTSPRIVPPEILQKMYDVVKTHVKLSARVGIKMKPKHHLLLHMVKRTLRHGNPGWYSTFEDEGINRILKQVGKAAHRTVWEVRVFSHFRKAEVFRGRKRPRTRK